MYFISENISSHKSSAIEKLIREKSLRRNLLIDITNSSNYSSEENKHFFAKESSKIISLVRIRSVFERILPRIIIVFEKYNFEKYRLRLSILSIALFSFLLLALFINIYYISTGEKGFTDVVLLTAVLILYIIFFFLEYYLTKRILNSILEKDS